VPGSGEAGCLTLTEVDQSGRPVHNPSTARQLTIFLHLQTVLYGLSFVHYVLETQGGKNGGNDRQFASSSAEYCLDTMPVRPDFQDCIAEMFSPNHSMPCSNHGSSCIRPVQTRIAFPATFEFDPSVNSPPAMYHNNRPNCPPCFSLLTLSPPAIISAT
jgi:hypothetical protein